MGAARPSGLQDILSHMKTFYDGAKMKTPTLIHAECKYFMKVK